MSIIIQNKLVLYILKNIELIFLKNMNILKKLWQHRRTYKIVNPKGSLYVARRNHNQSNSILEANNYQLNFHIIISLTKSNKGQHFFSYG